MYTKKKRILFVNGHLNIGGVEKSLTDLLRNLDYNLYDVDLLLLESVGTYASLLPSQVRILSKVNDDAYGSLPKIIYGNLIRFKWRNVVFRLTIVISSLLGIWVLKILRPMLGLRDNYDCAIAYRIGMPNVVVSTIVKADRKLCWWHNGECNLSTKQIEEIQTSWNQMDAIVAVSYPCKKMLLRHFKLHEDKIYVIPNIIDIAQINELAGNVSPYDNITEPIFVTLGRLCWEKHIEDVPDIAKRLFEDGIRRFKWFIIGDGSKREKIAHMIKKYELDNNVKMLGYLPNPYPYLKFANMLIHTSYVEAHCITLLEAMALHIPCVATKTEIPQEFVEKDINCYVAEQSVESQTTQIIRLMSNKELTNEIVDNAFKMVSIKYNADVIIPLIESII